MSVKGSKGGDRAFSYFLLVSRNCNFVSDQCEPELMCLFSADKFEGEVIECDEGDLLWVEKEKVPSLPTWEDAIFLKLFLEDEPRFF